MLTGKQSALLPVLRNLGDAGLLDSFVEPCVTGPPHRYYCITATLHLARLVGKLHGRLAKHLLVKA